MGRRHTVLEASPKGVSAVWQAVDDNLAEVELLLGDASNAAWALDSKIAGFDVSHVVCVASRRNADSLETRRLGGRGVEFSAYSMTDFLRPDDKVDIASDLEGPLAAIERAVLGRSRKLAKEPALAWGVNEELFRDSHGGTRAVLVHCDLGHNRAPVLTLAFLVRNGLSLRQAYRRVLRTRPTIDPLPPYRSGLRAFELEVHGCSSISGEEPFAMHISELMQLAEEGRPEEEEDDDLPAFEDALAMRNASVEALLLEEEP